MVFISTIIPLEELLKIDKEKRLNNLEWFLFDNHIKDKSLKFQTDIISGKGNSGNLECYMSRIYYYPLLYKEPLYCYLMSNEYFQTLDFLPEEYKYTAALWNMKRVPMFYNQKEEYPRIKEHERPFIYDDYYDLKEYMKRMFNKLIDNNFKKNPINFVILGSEKSLKETNDNVYHALNINKNHHNKNTHLLVEKTFEEYISKGGKKDLKYFEDTLDNYLIQGYCGY